MKLSASTTVCPVLFGLCSLCCACDDTRHDATTTDSGSTTPQQFIVAVESVGELFTGGEGVVVPAQTRRPISSVAPSQTFDNLDLIIVEYASPAKVVYKHHIGNWSSPNNIASIPWSIEDGQGRYTTVTLPAGQSLAEGKTYMAYVIGYQSGTFEDIQPFKDINVGDIYGQTEVANVPLGGAAEEIFAGAQAFVVRDGTILARANSQSELQQAFIVARRQVAGTFGYFTRIPVEANGQKVASLRLVATRRNRTVILGGFRGMEDLLDFSKDNVINGMNPRTDYDARLAGSTVNDAFVVYEIELNKWFPGNTENAALPFDSNQDGFLDSADTNWSTDEEMYPQGTISLPRGTVFGERFWIAVAMTQSDIESGTPTFQMQLLDDQQRVIKHWEVALRDYESAGEDRTLVSLPDGIYGRTLISSVENLDTETCFSIVRNRLYAMGEKNQSQSYGSDEPIDLSTAGTLVMNAKHQWQIQNSIIFD